MFVKGLAYLGPHEQAIARFFDVTNLQKQELLENLFH